MVIKKAKQGRTNANKGTVNKVETYYFDVEKCKYCQFKEGCYKEGSKYKTYSVTIKDDVHIKHMDYMKTSEFEELYGERYKIEAKNSEIKNNFGYDEANATGKVGITIQEATALFFSKYKENIEIMR